LHRQPMGIRQHVFRRVVHGLTSGFVMLTCYGIMLAALPTQTQYEPPRPGVFLFPVGSPFRNDSCAYTGPPWIPSQCITQDLYPTPQPPGCADMAIAGYCVVAGAVIGVLISLKVCLMPVWPSPADYCSHPFVTLGVTLIYMLCLLPGAPFVLQPNLQTIVNMENTRYGSCVKMYFEMNTPWTFLTLMSLGTSAAVLALSLATLVVAYCYSGVQTSDGGELE